MVYFDKPEKWQPNYFAGGVAVLCGERLLLLKRSKEERSEPEQWAFPAGGIDEGETASLAAVRELSEEAGILVKESDLNLHSKTYHIFSKSGAQLEFSLFLLTLDTIPRITLSPEEHSQYGWFLKTECVVLSLLEGNKELIESIIF